MESDGLLPGLQEATNKINWNFLFLCAKFPPLVILYTLFGEILFLSTFSGPNLYSKLVIVCPSSGPLMYSFPASGVVYSSIRQEHLNHISPSHLSALLYFSYFNLFSTYLIHLILLGSVGHELWPWDMQQFCGRRGTGEVSGEQSLECCDCVDVSSFPFQ
jgi:hypothetical protein